MWKKTKKQKKNNSELSKAHSLETKIFIIGDNPIQQQFVKLKFKITV